jgi:hypothetical protein
LFSQITRENGAFNFGHLPFFIAASSIGGVAQFIPHAAHSHKAESSALIRLLWLQG